MTYPGPKCSWISARSSRAAATKKDFSAWLSIPTTPRTGCSTSTIPPVHGRLETRLFVRGPDGWNGYTYLWNDAQTDADLLDEATTRTYRVKTASGVVEQPWYFPSRADGRACHTKATDFVLGPNTRQLNRPQDGDGTKANQIETFAKLGVFDKPPVKPVEELERYPDWQSETESTDQSVRAYLDVNCSFCHSPAGIAGKRPDLRFHTPVREMALVGRRPGQGRVGPEGSLLVTPGVPRRSELFYRMSARGSRQMPPLATNVPDDTALRRLPYFLFGTNFSRLCPSSVLGATAN